MSPRHLPRTTAPRSGPALALALLLVAVLVAACGGASTPSTASSAPPQTPGPATDVGGLIGDPAKDGQLVTVDAFFLAQDGVAQLCDVVMESYPPQCGEPSVQLTGEVPQAVLDALDSTSEPGLAQATWGQARVTGTYRASGADGRPTIELTSIEVGGTAE
jgi:hypothetical protein